MTLLDELERIVGVGEHVIYRGKPDKKCFIYESIFNPMLPIALIWGILDFGFMFGATSATSGVGFSGMLMFLIPFFALHLMPVWIYLGGVLLSAARHRNTAYIVTDQAIYVAKGVFSHTITRKPFAELSYINIHRGVFDRMFGVGDVIATTNQRDSNGHPICVRIESIVEYLEVYEKVKKLQTDIYSDTMYPNDLRPEENHGYNTQYKGF